MRTDLRRGLAACLLGTLFLLPGLPARADEIRVRVGPDGVEVFSNLESDPEAPLPAMSQPAEVPVATLVTALFPVDRAADEAPAISENVERLPPEALASVAAGKRFMFDD